MSYPKYVYIILDGGANGKSQILLKDSLMLLNDKKPVITL